MERHAEVFKPTVRRSLSDLMLHADRVAVQSPDQIKVWISDVIYIAKQVYPYHADIRSRKIENVWLRQAVMYISYWRWRDKISLKFVGRSIAEIIKRDKPFDHATIIHARNCHNNYMRFPKANWEYVVLFTTFREKLKEANLL